MKIAKIPDTQMLERYFEDIPSATHDNIRAKHEMEHKRLHPLVKAYEIVKREPKRART